MVVATIVAVVRKKKGIFGKMPVRTLQNEFTKAAETPGTKDSRQEASAQEVEVIPEYDDAAQKQDAQ